MGVFALALGSAVADDTLTLFSGAAGVLAGLAAGLPVLATRGASLSFGLARTKCGATSGLQPGPKPAASNSVSYEPTLGLPFSSLVVTSRRSSRLPARDGEQ